MNGLGSEVTQIIRKDRILQGFDDDIRAGIQNGMTQHGIKILQNTVVKEVERVPEGLQLKLSGEYEEPVIADVILAATGRTRM